MEPSKNILRRESTEQPRPLTRELTVSEAIRKRRSTKQFKPDRIPDALLQRLIDLIMLAPSGMNLQPVRLVIIEKAAQKEALARACKAQPQIATAPVILVFAVDVNGWRKTFDQTIRKSCELGAWPETVAAHIKNAVPSLMKGLGPKLYEHSIKDALVAADHAVLAAESLGLNSCYMNGWEEDLVKEIIGAKDNDNISIGVLVPIGYAAGIPKFPGRLPHSLTVFREKLLG